MIWGPPRLFSLAGRIDGMMRSLLAITALLACSGTLAQVTLPHDLQPNTKASASKVMENFRALETAIEGVGGCTATQQDNSVLIECADGTSGVIAGAGTVVLLPEGTVGETPNIENISVGDFYYADGNGVLLSRYYEGLTEHYYGVSTTLGDSLSSLVSMQVHQVDETQTLYLLEGGAETTLYYAEFDCLGTPWAGVNGGALRFDGQWWVFGLTEASGQQTLLKSYRTSDKYIGWDDGGIPGSWELSECVNLENPSPITIGAFPALYDPPTEWLNAAYPLTLVQKPQ
jgi:hypothetical protein